MKYPILITLGLVMYFTGLNAQENSDKFDAVVIKTSAVCEMCIATIEKGFAFEKGVKSSEVDLASNTVTVTFKKGKTDGDALRTALTKMGYAADDIRPEKSAYENLHHCCKADFDHGTN